MRKISLLLALVLMVSFTATATMAGPGAEPDPVGSGNEITVTPSPPSHTVRPGDTLWDIARRYKVPLADLLAANRLTPASVLAVGQVVMIPTAGDKAAAAFKPTSGSSSVRYRVQRGNTLWDIAIAYGVTVESVMKANRLDKDSILAVGQELTIPRPQRTPAAGELAPPAPPPAPIQAATPLTVTQVVSATAATEGPPEISASAGISGEVGVQDTAAITATVAPPAEAVLPAPNELAILVFTLINEQRAGHGLAPLAWSPILAQAAQAHAEDCARRNYGSHVGSDGARLRQRLTRAGYQPSAASENWVFSRSPQSGVAWWYDEPPGRDAHRRNILSTQYAEVGVGIVQDETGLYYIVADFGRA